MTLSFGFLSDFSASSATSWRTPPRARPPLKPPYPPCRTRPPSVRSGGGPRDSGTSPHCRRQLVHPPRRRRRIKTAQNRPKVQHFTARPVIKDVFSLGMKFLCRFNATNECRQFLSFLVFAQKRSLLQRIEANYLFQSPNYKLSQFCLNI